MSHNTKKSRADWYQANKHKVKEKNKQAAIAFRKKNPERAMLTAAKYRAKKNNLPFDLEVSDIVLPTHCPILKIPLLTYAGQGNNIRKDSYSLDRIDPTKGYTKDNIQVISGLANRMKQNATQEELILFADWVIKTYLTQEKK